MTTAFIRLTERDIRCFLQEPVRPFWRLASFWYAPVGILLLGTIFISLNADAYLRVQALAKQNSTPEVTQAAAPTPQSTPTPTPENGSVAVAISTPTPVPTVAPISIPNNTVNYASLGIAAPVSWDTPFTDATLNTRLENGAVHLAGTAHPGQNGTVVIFGHSSYYPWGKGNFKTVFAPLLKGSTGNIFEVTYNNVLYRYKVTKHYEVAADDFSIFKGDTNNGIRLVTCTPIGTSLKRYVVEATQISPEPASNTAFNQVPLSGSLPGDQ